jgi:flagellar motor switch protein FliM
LVSSRKLSSDEVEALIDGLQDQPATSSSQVTMSDDNVRPFDFGSDDLSLLGDYYALRMLNERFARAARSVFLPMLRIQPRISSFPPEVKTFDEYTSGIESFMSLTTNRVEELRGNLLIVVDPNFVSLLTNSYYGGTISKVEASRSEFTATEERVIEIISNGLSRGLETCWRELMPLTLNVHSRETNPQFASFVDSSDLVIICSFVVQLPNVDAATFDVIYPLQTLKPIASLLRSRVQTETLEDDISWRDRLELAVLNVPLKVTARLCEPVVSVRKLIHLQEGDVFPIQVGDGVEMRVEDKPIFMGEMGELGGNSAINLKERLKL